MSQKLFCFVVNPEFSLDQVVEELEQKGVQIAYSDEDEKTKLIYGYYENNVESLYSDHIIQITPYQLPDIDWENQWALHGLNYQDGFIFVNLHEGKEKEIILKLQPGPGFGDLSHPTTRLALKLLTEHIKNVPVIDIGCGSGILTLAAAALGSSKAIGIDIDREALEHSRKNGELNELNNKCFFFHPSEFKLHPSGSTIILMNMILSEQKEAWQSLPFLHKTNALCITSGIRKEEKNEYLNMTKKWGWKILQEFEEEGWMAFFFSQGER